MTNNKQTLIEQFVIECGKYGDTAQIPDDVIEKYIKMEKEQIEQAELDAKEIIIIKQCAEQSTSEASKYADGYAEGYKRALDYISNSIENAKALISSEII